MVLEKIYETINLIIMKTVIFSLATLTLLLSNVAFSQYQRLEPVDNTRKINKQELLYCGMLYQDDSTRTEQPKQRHETKTTERKPVKRTVPTRSEKPAEVRRWE
jgi:hypothetical protein